MARPSQDAIDTFISITGASEAVAIEKLEAHGGDLNEAVNAYFNEGDRTNVHPVSGPASRDDFMDIDDAIDADFPVPASSLLPGRPASSLLPGRPASSLLSVAQSLNPFAILNSTFGQFFDGSATEFSNRMPHVSHPREVREIPIEFKDGNNRPASSSHGPTIEEVTGSIPAHGPEIHGTVIIDDEDEEPPSAPTGYQDNRIGNNTMGSHPGPNFTPLANISDYGNDIEEEMIQAAIEASKREAESSVNQRLDVPNGSTGQNVDNASPALEDTDLAQAVSLSLKTAEEEKELRELGLQVGEQSSYPMEMNLEDIGRIVTANGRQGSLTSHTRASGKSIVVEGNSVVEDACVVDEQPLLRHRSRRFAVENAESTDVALSPPLSPNENANGSRQPNEDAFQTDEWGGISSEEHDEAVMLEAAMFGGIPKRGAYNFTYPHPPVMHSDRSSDFYPRIARPPSPSLTAQRLLREQQDDEYLAALQADKEKELKAQQEAERVRLEEATAREAAVKEAKRREEEVHRKFREEEEFERILAAKQATLPPEPSSDDESAVTLLIRMPDGNRCGRRFLKSDKFQSLFDYLDVGRVVKPGTYRLVRPYPRHAFSDEERALSLGELGLTGKQEALFLELI